MKMTTAYDRKTSVGRSTYRQIQYYLQPVRDAPMRVGSLERCILVMHDVRLLFSDVTSLGIPNVFSRSGFQIKILYSIFIFRSMLHARQGK
jgi:hypothetical protein